MANTEQKNNLMLVDQEDALSQYMDALLTRPNSLDKSARRSAVFAEQGAPKLDLSLFLPDVPSSQELESIEKQQQIELNKELKQELDESKQDNSLLQQQLSESLKKIDGLAKIHTELYAPDWAQSSFQIILFNVGNLKLALPLKDLNSIVVWDKKFLTEMPGSANWYLGLISHLGKNIPVIDTLQQVVPENKLTSFIQKRGQFKHVIIIDNESWGLACEEIIGIKTLKVEEIKWRSSRTSRKWLLGTVKEQMCALLDSNEFTAMLSTGEGSLAK